MKKKNSKKKFSKVFRKLDELVSKEGLSKEYNLARESVYYSKKEFEEIDELRRLSEEYSSPHARLFTQT